MNKRKQVQEVIDKSNQGLKQVYQEAAGANSRSSTYPHPPMSSSAYKDNGNRIFNDVINGIENNVSPTCGPHQTAAIRAFHASQTGTARPLSRGRGYPSNDLHSVEARIKQSVEHIIDDKLVGTSRAIDALRDQLSSLADEVREINRSASSQERRVDILCHDVDSRRGLMNDMQAHISDESSWRKITGSEIGRLKESLAQQKQDAAAKATLAEVRTGFESSRRSSIMSIESAMSPLQASISNEINKMKSEVDSLRDDMKRQLSHNMHQISNSTQAYQANLVGTITAAVKEEAVLIEQRCLEAVEKKAEQISSTRNAKEYVKIIAAIVTKAAAKTDKIITDKVMAKLSEQRSSDLSAVSKQVKEEVCSELHVSKGLLKQIAAKQVSCISKSKAEALIDTCRAQINGNIRTLEDRLIAKIPQTESNNDTIKAFSISLSSHNTLLQQLKKENDSLVTKGDVDDVVTRSHKDLFDRCKTLVKDSERGTNNKIDARIGTILDSEGRMNDYMKSQMAKCKSQLEKDLLDLRRILVTKEAADAIAESRSKEQYDRCVELIRGIENTVQSAPTCQDAVLESVNSQLRDERNKMFDATRNFITKEELLATIQHQNTEQLVACKKKIDESSRATDEHVQTQVDLYKAQLMADVSNKFQKMATKADFLEIATHVGKEQYDECKTQLCKEMTEKLHHHATNAFVEEKVERCQQIIHDNGHITDSRIQMQINECREQLMRDTTLCESFNSNNLEIAEGLESRMNNVESGYEQMLDVFETLDSRVQAVENMRAYCDINKELEETATSPQNTPDHSPPEFSGSPEHNDSPIIMRSESPVEEPLSPSNSSEGSLSSIVHLLGLGGTPDSLQSQNSGHNAESKEGFLGDVVVDLSDLATAKNNLEGPSCSSPSHHEDEDLFDQQSSLSQGDNSHISINTADALSLCGVNTNDDDFRDNIVRKESPVSLEGSIETTEALAICGIPATNDQHGAAESDGSAFVKTPSLDTSQPNSTPMLSEEIPNESIHLLFNQIDHGESDLQEQKSDQSNSTPMQTCLSAPQEKLRKKTQNYGEDVYYDICSESNHHSSSLEVNSSISAVEGYGGHSNSLYCHGPHVIYDEESSVPGSITTFDDIVELQTQSARKSCADYNPTRTSNPEPYKGWDVLLTELKASGLTLQDNESPVSPGGSSYGSCSFDSEQESQETE